MDLQMLRIGLCLFRTPDLQHPSGTSFRPILVTNTMHFWTVLPMLRTFLLGKYHKVFGELESPPLGGTYVGIKLGSKMFQPP